MIPSQATLDCFEASQWAALARPDVTWSTYYNALGLMNQDIPGDFVECGVFAGVQIAMMYRAMVDSEKELRKIHLFDCFEGIPGAGPEDTEIEGLPGQAKCSVDHVRTYLRSWGVPESILVFHIGLIEDTAAACERFPIAYLRIDCDLYRGIAATLEHLYPQLVPFGVCVLDDYAFPGARQAWLECFGAAGQQAKEVSPLTWQRR